MRIMLRASGSCALLIVSALGAGLGCSDASGSSPPDAAISRDGAVPGPDGPTPDAPISLDGGMPGDDDGGTPGDEDAGPAVFPACPTFAGGVVSGTVASAEIREASGLVASRRHPGVLWVHNDSGDTARIFATRPDGTHLGIYSIMGAGSADWEDIVTPRYTIGTETSRAGMTTGLRELTDADVQAELERVIAPALIARMANRQPGHCARVTDAEAPLAARLCEKVRAGADAGSRHSSSASHPRYPPSSRSPAPSLWNCAILMPPGGYGRPCSSSCRQDRGPAPRTPSESPPSRMSPSVTSTPTLPPGCWPSFPVSCAASLRCLTLSTRRNGRTRAVMRGRASC